jgi:outer membrane protein assembly factor BamD
MCGATMHKRYLHFTLTVLIIIGACAALPDPGELKTDLDYFTWAMSLYESGNHYDAIPAFEELRDKFPLSPYAVLAELRLGDSHFFKGEYIESVHYFENFRRLHPTNEHVPYSIYMTGTCYYEQILSPDRDQTFSQQAIEQFQLLLDLYPTSPYTGSALRKLSEVRKRVAEHEFVIGHFYLRKGNFKGAIDRFNALLKVYPYSIDRDKVLFYLGQATLLSEEIKKGEKILELLIKRYPDSPYIIEAKTLLGQPVKDDTINKEELQGSKDHDKKFFFF